MKRSGHNEVVGHLSKKKKKKDFTATQLEFMRNLIWQQNCQTPTQQQ